MEFYINNPHSDKSGADIQKRNNEEKSEWARLPTDVKMCPFIMSTMLM